MWGVANEEIVVSGNRDCRMWENENSQRSHMKIGKFQENSSGFLFFEKQRRKIKYNENEYNNAVEVGKFQRKQPDSESK